VAADNILFCRSVGSRNLAFQISQDGHSVNDQRSNGIRPARPNPKAEEDKGAEGGREMRRRRARSIGPAWSLSVAWRVPSRRGPQTSLITCRGQSLDAGLALRLSNGGDGGVVVPLLPDGSRPPSQTSQDGFQLGRLELPGQVQRPLLAKWTTNMAKPPGRLSNQMVQCFISRYAQARS